MQLRSALATNGKMRGEATIDQVAAKRDYQLPRRGSDLFDQHQVTPNSILIRSPPEGDRAAHKKAGARRKSLRCWGENDEAVRAHDPRMRQVMRGGDTRSPASPAAAHAGRAARQLPRITGK
jgi:hypothetical protein